MCLGQAPSVAITAPSGSSFTNGVLPIEVSVANGTPDRVELLANDVLVVSLGSQRSYEWETAAVPEGAYELVARAVMDGQVIASEPRTVVVDRTVPTALSRSPQNGDGNVPLGTPLQVVFSEPMSPSAITDSTVSVTDAQGIPAAKQLILSADAKTLTIVLGGTPPLPATLTVGLQGASDLAGNALAPVGPWTFTLQAAEDHSPPTVLTRMPETGSDNVQVGTPFQVTFSEPIRPSSVTDSAVAVAGSGSVALSKHLVLSPDGRTLGISLVGAPPLPTTIDISLQGLTDFAGNPLSAPATTWSFTIPDWWHPWPLPLSEVVTDLGEVPIAVAVDAAGAPVVAHLARPGGPVRDQKLIVSRWNGATWLNLASPLNTIGNAYGPAIAVAPDGAPILAWLEYNGSEQYVMVARWSGSEWTSMSGSRLDSSQALNVNKSLTSSFWSSSNSAAKVSLALDSSGYPTVAWQEAVPTGISSNTAFNTLVAQWNGNAWSRLGSASTYPAKDVIRAALSLHGVQPVVATVEQTVDPQRRSDVYVRRWVNGVWVSSFGASSINSGEYGNTPTIILDSEGNPVVSYAESTGVYVKRWSALSRAWETVAIHGSERLLDASWPSLAVDRHGNRFLAYSASSGRQPMLLRWGAVDNTWQQVGGALSSKARAAASPSLALTTEGVPVISWAEDGHNVPLSYDLMVKILNR